MLDVASGEGYGSAILAGVARSVVGVDIDPRSVAHAQEAYRAENLRFLQGDAIDLPVEKASVDVVVSFETLEHIREHAQFAAEVRRVLRPAGRFIVSTPDRAIYSARGEHFNEYHLLELTETEFESFLHAHFARAIILHQRAIFGSVIAAADSGWRSYERRAHEYVEASGGLTRSPYLVGIASDADLPQIASTAYVDRRNPEEVWRGYVRAGVIESERDARARRSRGLRRERPRLRRERPRRRRERPRRRRERPRPRCRPRRIRRSRLWPSRSRRRENRSVTPLGRPSPKPRRAQPNLPAISTRRRRAGSSSSGEKQSRCGAPCLEVGATDRSHRGRGKGRVATLLLSQLR